MSTIQINPLISSHTATSKDDLKKKAKANNYIRNWQTISDVTPLQMADYIGKGYALRGGVRVKGNKADHVESIQWLFLDFDHSTLQKSLQVSVSQFACLYYFTYSYIPGENEKHRLLFKLDRAITTTEYSSLISYLLSTFYTEADIIESPGSLFFGAKCPEYVHILDENATFPVDNFLNVIGSLSTIGSMEGITPPISPNASTFTGDSKAALPSDKADEELIKPRLEALRHIAKHIWLDKCNAEDIDTLYCLDKHNFEKQPKGQNLAKWHGHRPDDTEKANGTGFLVIWNDEQLPPTWQNQADGIKGNIVDYWHKYSGKEFGDIDWKTDKDFTNFSKVVDDICNYFKIEPFDFDEVLTARNEQKKEKRRQKYQSLSEILDKYTYMIKSGAKDIYVYYDVNSGVWLLKPDAQQVWRDCVKPIMKLQGSDEELENPKISSYYISLIKNYSEYKPISKTHFDMKIDYNWVPMSNGDFNWKTKEFVKGFNPEIHNQFRYLFSYNESATDENESVKLLNDWLDWNYGNTPTRQAVLDWLAMNAVGIAGETNKILCFWGQPGSGKSVILNLINNLLGELASPIDSKKLGIADNRFIFQGVDGKYAVTIDEFRTNTVGWDNLKQLAGTYRPIIDCEKKGLSSYKTIYRGSVTTASQDNFSMPPGTDGGIRRRVITIQHTEQMINPMYADIDYKLAQPEAIEAIFNWLLTLDIEGALKRFVEWSKSSEVKENLLNVIIENDTVLQFMMDKLEFTDNPEDKVSNFDIQIAYKMFLINDLSQPVDNKDEHRIAKVTQYIREKASIKDNGIKWSLCPKKGENARISVDGKQVKGFKGVKVKSPSESDCPI